MAAAAIGLHKFLACRYVIGAGNGTGDCEYKKAYENAHDLL
jgi:hypothetical protein